MAFLDSLGSQNGLFGLWTALQKGFRRLRRHRRRCVISSPSTLATQLQAARRIPPLSLQSRCRCRCSLSGKLSLGCSSASGWRNASPFRSPKLCWTPSLLNRPNVLERKRRGSVLASAGTPRKTACYLPPSLRAPEFRFQWVTSCRCKRVPECFTTVIVDPHTIKSKLPLHALSLTHSLTHSLT